MSEIPKRPIFALYTDDATADLWLVHEHAVAKVAVEALRELDGSVHEINLRHVSATIREALAKIEASGWTP